MPHGNDNVKHLDYRRVVLACAVVMLCFAALRFIAETPRTLNPGQPVTQTESPEALPDYRYETFEPEFDLTQERPSPFIPFEAPRPDLTDKPLPPGPRIDPLPAQPEVDRITPPGLSVVFNPRDEDPGVAFVGTARAAHQAVALLDHAHSGRRLRLRVGDRLPDSHWKVETIFAQSVQLKHDRGWHVVVSDGRFSVSDAQ